MEFWAVLRRRRMTRRYDVGRSVEAADVDVLLDAGLRAPSAGNSQGWHFLVLDDAASVERYWAVTTADGPDDQWLDGMRTAPVLIIVYSHRATYVARYAAPDKLTGRAPVDLADRWPVPYWHIDAGMAALLIQLAAVDRGLASCWFAVPTDRADALGAAFNVPTDFTPVGVVSVGHSTGRTPTRSAHLRRPRCEVVSYRGFGRDRS